MPPNSFGRPENKWAEHGTFYIYQPNARQKIVFSAGLEGFLSVLKGSAQRVQLKKAFGDAWNFPFYTSN